MMMQNTEFQRCSRAVFGAVLACWALSGFAQPVGPPAPAPVSTLEASAEPGSPSEDAALPPWTQVGLSDRQAAVHALNRLTFGPRPGDIDQVLSMGLDNWIERQLSGDSSGPVLAAALERLPVLALDADGMSDRYPHHALIVSEAIAEGVIERRDYQGRAGEAKRRQAEAALDRFARQRGYQPQSEVLWQLQAQKLYHALLSESQLREVLTDFWFNHFNVAARGEVRAHVLSYENEAIRPRVLGDFKSLLSATARHPAMLYYLGNVHSVADPGRPRPLDEWMAGGFTDFAPDADRSLKERLKKELPWRPLAQRRQLPRAPGLNENYARELLELHTLGVLGGYTQDDVIEVARAFTGWTLLPQSPSRQALEELLRSAAEHDELGFVVDSEFVFRPDLHDGEAKQVMGRQLASNRGIEDGLEVLDLVADHPATAAHLSRKLLVRFVADDPSETLVQGLASTFRLSGGDLRQVMRRLIASPEFWRGAHQPNKFKTPFELAMSSLRAIDAQVDEPKGTMYWVRRIGQPAYLFGAPTGFSDRKEAWADAGALLQRVNWGLALARGRVPGVEFDRQRLLADLEPVTLEETVAILLPLVLPERLPGEQLAELAGLWQDPVERVDPLAGDPSARATALRQARLERNTIYALAVLFASPEFQYR